MDNHLANDELIEMIKSCTEKPSGEKGSSQIGCFADVFDILACKEMEQPMLVSSCYGTGEKLKVALSINRFETVGRDSVAVCVNDLISVGAQPLLFTYHIACTKNKADVTSQIVAGVEAGCRESGISYSSAKISELSNLYGPEELGITGFAVGLVDKDSLIDGSTIKPGNSVIGIASSGLHSNGYSKVSTVFRNFNEGILSTYFDNIGGTLADVMLEPVIIYRKAIESVKNEQIRIRGIAPISDGGFRKNIKRILPEGTSAEISRSSFAHPEIFRMIEETGGFSMEDMYDTFNMGIGMVIVVASQDRDTALRAIRHSGEMAFLIGTIKEGDQEVWFSD